MWAAEASLCAADQGQFWPYHDTLFANQGAFSKSELEKYASNLGLNTDTFDACLEGGEHSQDVQNLLEEGRSKGVNSSPTILVNEVVIKGAQPFQTFQEAIDRELARLDG